MKNQTVLQDIVPVLILSSASLPLLVSILKKRGRPTLTAEQKAHNKAVLEQSKLETGADISKKQKR